MTKVDIYFSAPENQFGIELGPDAEVAYQHYLAHEAEYDDYWIHFLDVLREQMTEHIVNYTDFEEVSESE